MWCHLTFRCQSNWLTGKKINSKRPVPAKASGEVASGVGKSRIGAFTGQRDEAKHGMSRQTLCQAILAPGDAGERNQPPPGACFPIPGPPAQGFGTLWGSRPQHLHGRVALGSWGSLTLSEVLTSKWFFFSPYSGWRKEGLFKKKYFWADHWEKKAELNKSLILVILKRLLQFFYLTIFYWF